MILLNFDIFSHLTVFFEIYYSDNLIIVLMYFPLYMLEILFFLVYYDLLYQMLY